MKDHLSTAIDARRNARRALLVTAALSSLPALAWDASPASSARSYPAYRARKSLRGLVRIWGLGSGTTSDIAGLVTSLELAFRSHQPDISFETMLRGNATAIGGLYTGVADIALMDRAPLDIELDGYSILKHSLFGISIATGSLSVGDHAAAPVVFVNRFNPLRSLTLAQLDAILGADHRRGTRNIRNWGDLDRTSAWSNKEINVHVPKIASDVSRFIETTVMKGSRKWTDRLTEYTDRVGINGGLLPANRQIIDALAMDRYGLAIANFSYVRPQVSSLTLAVVDGEPGIAATRDNLVQRRYPLTRTISMFANREPGKALDPNVSEFARFVLSDEGQGLIEADGGYLPLTPDMARAEWDKLE